MSKLFGGTSGSVALSEFRLRAHASYGAVNTKVPNYTNTDKNVGSAMTVVSTQANSGSSVTINQDGVYSFQAFIDGATNGVVAIAIVLNGTSLTTDIFAVTGAERLQINNSQASGGAEMTVGVSWTGFLNRNDVIRVQTNGATPQTTANAGFSGIHLR